MAKMNPLNNPELGKPQQYILLAYLELCPGNEHHRKLLLEECREMYNGGVGGFGKAYERLEDLGYLKYVNGGMCRLNSYERNNEWETVVENVQKSIKDGMGIHEMINSLKVSIEIKRPMKIFA